MSPAAPVRRVLLAAVFSSIALAGLADEAQAADAPQTYVVLSLVGDKFSVVKRRAQVGTRVDANERLEFPIADPTLDRIATLAAEASIQRARPGANVLQASIRDARLFAAQDQLLAESAESKDLRAGLQGLLAKYGATHLVLVTKRRSEAAFKMVNGTTGSGSLAGLGFYLDTSTNMVRVGSKENSPGFLGTYSYATVSLLDAASMRLIRSESALESSMSLTVDDKDAVRAWDALTPEGKVDALERVIRSGVGRAVTAVLAE